MRRAGLLAAVLVPAGAVLVAAGPARAEVRVEVRVTEEVGQSALVEFSTDQAAWVALYGSFSDGSLRTLFPGEDPGGGWVPANEVRVISVELDEGIHLDSVQAIASPRWFDPRELWIAGAPAAPRPGCEPGAAFPGTGRGTWA